MSSADEDRPKPVKGTSETPFKVLSRTTSLVREVLAAGISSGEARLKILVLHGPVMEMLR